MQKTNLPPLLISGGKNVQQWRSISETLKNSDDPNLWEKIFKDYYESRLQLRYFAPINILSQHGAANGEGFSIVAIQCSLIEFFESCWQGKNYRYLRKGEKLKTYEYNKSGDIFVEFLTKRKPFDTIFDKSLAEDFYTNIRCPVLHEACTRNGWRIWKNSTAGTTIDRNQKILFRNNFQDAIKSFVSIYRADLLKERATKDAFIRKFDYICG